VFGAWPITERGRGCVRGAARRGARAGRREGETFVLPVIEDVVTRRLRLLEEWRVRRRSRVVRKPRTVTVRREEAFVQRLPGTMH
jgi:hypothetical protein